MIGTDYLRLMARYNAWQNRAHIAEADKLSDAVRQEDRGAFFGSIQATMNHLLWGDRGWMSRFDNTDPPLAKGFAASTNECSDWAQLKAARASTDLTISDWAGRETQDKLDGDLTWFSSIVNKQVTKPMGGLVVHFFNHQTHHRGQIHAMLTAAGASPVDTDIFVMPDDA